VSTNQQVISSGKKFNQSVAQRLKAPREIQRWLAPSSALFFLLKGYLCFSVLYFKLFYPFSTAKSRYINIPQAFHNRENWIFVTKLLRQMLEQHTSFVVLFTVCKVPDNLFVDP
jgi:hypothetical protein